MSTLTRRRGMYTYAGREYPSVTTILGALAKPALPNWAAREAATAAWDVMQSSGPMPPDRDAWIKRIAGAPWRASRDAAGRGTAVHGIAHRLMRGEDVRDADVPADLRGYVVGLRAFVAERDVAMLHGESTVVNESEGYAGTLDAIVQFGAADVLTLADFKTVVSEAKATVWPEARMQLAAYARAEKLVPDDGDAIDMPETARGAIIHVWPGGYRVTDVGDEWQRGHDYEAFLHLRDVWRWMRAANGKGGDDDLP